MLLNAFSITQFTKTCIVWDWLFIDLDRDKKYIYKKLSRKVENPTLLITRRGEMMEQIYVLTIFGFSSYHLNALSLINNKKILKLVYVKCSLYHRSGIHASSKTLTRALYFRAGWTHVHKDMPSKNEGWIQWYAHWAIYIPSS